MCKDIKSLLKEVNSQPQAIASLLLFVALKEARRYKWDQSKKAGKDLGQKEVSNWFKKHFSSWYRDQWVKHMYGENFWKEFGEKQFNIVKNNSIPNHDLLSQIIESVNNYGENLGIIIWASKTNQKMQDVLHLLKLLNINDQRIEMEEDQIKVLSEALDEADKYKWIASQKAGYDLGEAAVVEWFRTSWFEYYSKMKDVLDKK